MPAKTLSQMIADFTEAQLAARRAVALHVDGGTCNFDSCVIFSPPSSDLEQAAKLAGLRVYRRNWLDKSAYFLSTPVGAQGSVRTLQAEAMERELRGRGYDATVYYQMD